MNTVNPGNYKNYMLLTLNVQLHELTPLLYLVKSAGLCQLSKRVLNRQKMNFYSIPVN
jgi:hypothetical protein